MLKKIAVIFMVVSLVEVFFSLELYQLQSIPSLQASGPPQILNSFIDVYPISADGVPVSGAKVKVSFIYPSPYDYYNYSYEVTVDMGPYARVYIEFPPSHYEAKAVIEVIGPKGDISADKIILDNLTYGTLLVKASGGSFLSKTFVVSK